MIQALKNFRTYGLAVDFYRECKEVKLTPSLRDQLTRATESIVLNLAEGSAKPTPKDRARFYTIALGSYRESQAILSLANQDNVLAKHDQLGACLYKLTRATQN
jgi:four helix bundle protein